MTVIFKLGGSLLNLADLAGRAHALFAQRTGQKCLIVPGGGVTADIVREWSRVHHLSEEAAHWLAVSSMDLNGQFLQRLLGWNGTRSCVPSKQLWESDCSPLVLQMSEYLQTEEAIGGDPLPHNWSVSSDSLAAWSAFRWPAEELVLIKSVPVPRGLTAAEASHRKVVDEHFPIVSRRLNKISWCNLRASKIIIEPWLADSADPDRAAHVDSQSGIRHFS